MAHMVTRHSSIAHKRPRDPVLCTNGHRPNKTKNEYSNLNKTVEPGQHPRDFPNEIDFKKNFKKEEIFTFANFCDKFSPQQLELVSLF